MVEKLIQFTKCFMKKITWVYLKFTLMLRTLTLYLNLTLMLSTQIPPQY